MKQQPAGSAIRATSRTPSGTPSWTTAPTPARLALATAVGVVVLGLAGVGVASASPRAASPADGVRVGLGTAIGAASGGAVAMSAERSGRAHRAHRGWSRGRSHYRGGFYWRPSFYSSWHWPGYYARPYGYAYYGGYGGYYGDSSFHPDAGALDLDIKPEDASIYLDGELIGVADNYDGWPRYLWLREGTYRLVIHMEGYQTLAREVRIRPGQIISLKDRMQPGPSKTPEELYAQLEPERSASERSRGRRDDGGRDVARRRAAPEPRDTRAPAEARESDRDDDDWRSRERSAPPPPARSDRERPAQAPIDADQRSAPARLRLVVDPPDAVVYLDGRLLGSGEELARLHSDLIVDPGSHRLEVTRPGYRTHSIELELGAGESRDVVAELERER